METGRIAFTKEDAKNKLEGKPSQLDWKSILGDLPERETLLDIADSDSCCLVLFEENGIDCRGAAGEEPCQDYSKCKQLFDRYTQLTEEEAPETPQATISAETGNPVSEGVESVSEDTVEGLISQMSDFFEEDISVVKVSPRMTKVLCDGLEVATLTQKGIRIKHAISAEDLGLGESQFTIKHGQVLVEFGAVADWGELMYKFFQIVCSNTAPQQMPDEGFSSAKRPEDGTEGIFLKSPSPTMCITGEDSEPSTGKVVELLTQLGIHSVIRDCNGEYIFLKVV